MRKNSPVLLMVLALAVAGYAQDNDAFFDAAKAGDATKVGEFLQQGVDVNLKTRYGATALTFASDRGHVEVARLLLKRGADPNLPDEFYKATPLNWAAAKGNYAIVESMLQHGADLSVPQPLQWAVYGGNPEIVQLMLKRGAVGADNAIVMAVRLQNTELVRVILQHSDLSGEALTPALSAATASENEQIITMLEEAGAVLPDEPDMSQQDSNESEEHSQSPIIPNSPDPDMDVEVTSPKNWPSFRGEQASGIADGQHPPTIWNAEQGLNIRWKTEIPGLAHSSPIVWGDHVFVTTAISGDTSAIYRVGLYGDVDAVNDTTVHTWKIYCLDKNTGEILWQDTAYRGVPEVKRHMKATQANSTPATDGEYVVALFGSEGLACYDFNGELLWKKDLGILDAGWFYDDGYEWGHASSPIIYKNLVIVQCDRQRDSYIAAYHIQTGAEVWKTPREEIPSWGTPTIFYGEKRDELITNASRFIRAYDPNTGEELWRLAPNSEITVATPIVHDGLIYVTAGYPPVRPIYAIRPGGSGDISLPDSVDSGEFIVWRTKRGGTYMPTPIAYDGYLYMCSNNGIVTCYDARSGEQIYKARVAGRGGYAFTASPVAADGKLYFTSEEGEVFVVKAAPEYELIAKNPVGEVCMATPAISYGMIFIRGQHHVFGIGRVKN